jgi:nucleoside-diphosphate-sugar epimerase
MASLAGVEVVSGDPVGTMRTTLMGSLNLLMACLRVPGVRRVVLTSSSEVYGPDADGVGEDDAVLPQSGEPRWSYAVSKLAAERLGLACHRQHGLEVCVVRPFNVYGPGQVGPGAVHGFVRRALANAPIELHNGGDQVRAWCFVDDLTAGMEAALFSSAAVGQVFNLGNPRAALSIRELAQMIIRLCDSGSRLVPVSRSGPEVRVRIPDILRAQRLLGFDPRVDLEQGLQPTIAWYRQQVARQLEVAGG